MNRKLKTITETADHANRLLRRSEFPKWYRQQDVAREIGSLVSQAVWFACYGGMGNAGPIESLNWARNIGREDHYIAPNVLI
jgi:hypothetical protein